MEDIEQQLRGLEHRIDELITLCNRLKEENRILRNKEQTLRTERVRLMERNEIATRRVESILSRLKSMDQSVQS